MRIQHDIYRAKKLREECKAGGDHAFTLSARIAAVVILPLLALASAAASASDVSPKEARQIAREAYVYGYPIVDNYRVQYSYFVDKGGPNYKAPYNYLFNIPRVYTPADTAVQTPNSDTPYSWIGLDLRTEPIVFTVPDIAKDRYWSLQLVDFYTYNFDYLGTRTTGNDGGSYMVVGPNWHGAIPEGIKKVLHCDTEIASAQFRTQLFNPEDLENVKKIQDQYIVKPLSGFLRTLAPKPAPPIQFPKPLSAQEERTSLDFFSLLNFALGYCPTVPSEKVLRARFALIGVDGGLPFDPSKQSPEMKTAMQDGIADAWRDFAALKQKADKGEVTSGDVFGTREFLGTNYLYRMAGAVLGIYGNSKAEAMYPAYYVDSKGRQLDGAHGYTLHFAPGQLPPVDAFWSLTMYDLPQMLLVANPLNRYLLNSTMLSELKRDADGGLTLYLSKDSPGPNKEANWLPAPQGPFFAMLRLYLPKPQALDGNWKAPLLQRPD